MRFDDRRKLMVKEQIIERGISDNRVINALLKVPRESFIPIEWQKLAYSDHPLEIGYQQTISQPYIVAYMLSLLDLNPSDRVLEIGTGCGYVTALLAEMVAEVFTIERIEDLLYTTKQRLKKMGYHNIHYHTGDGSVGWVNCLPHITEFEKIIISAACPDTPKTLLSQLSMGGRMVTPQGSLHFQELYLYQKSSAGVMINKYGGCIFVPLIGNEGFNTNS